MNAPRSSAMTARRLIAESLRFHARSHLALALGVAVGTAVLTGALVVGDSVRGSLRDLALERLGQVDAALVTDRFFHATLADDFDNAVPLVMLEGSVAMTGRGRRANHVSLLGVDERFARLGAPGEPPFLPPADGEIVLNAPLAEALGASVGQEVLVHLPTPSFVPRDSPLGRKIGTIENRRLRIVRIVSEDGLGQFSLAPNPRPPLNAFLPLGVLQQALDRPGRVNALLVATPEGTDVATLQDRLKPTLDDLGLHVALTDHGYFNLTSDRMLLDPPAVEAAMHAFGKDRIQPVFTYLANDITAGAEQQAKIPYSTIAALDVTTEPPLGPFVTADGRSLTSIGPDEIVLNRWAVDDLAAQGVTVSVGDPVTITYFDPESTHGQVRESTATFALAEIVELAGAADDRLLTPEVKGVTDEDSIADWDPPFPYDPSRVRSVPPNDQDDRYWKERRATPKAFVNLATGRRLWGSRFGNTTSLRIPAEGLTLAEVERRWQPDPVAMGFEWRPVRALAIAASSGTTPFEGLFLGFSMFIIASAVMLVILLFRLSIERRAREIGILLAVGLGPRRVRRLLTAEGAIVAVIGGLLGVGLGVGYAALMLAGLRTWWLAAVTTPRLFLHVVPTTLAIGYACGVIVSMLSIVWAVRRLRRTTARQLLAGHVERVDLPALRAGRWYHRAGWILLILAVAISASGRGLSGEAQAGAFFGAGFLVLMALLAFVRCRLQFFGPRLLVRAGGWPLARLAFRNGSRHVWRSLLTIGLVAIATFLIVAISAFHIEPPPATTDHTSGTGGYALVAESDQPIFYDLGTADGRDELGFSTANSTRLDDGRVESLRLAAGDDASCRNLFQVVQPQLLGVPPGMIDRGGFEWAAIADDASDAERANPWLLLDRPLGDAREPLVPVVIDAATAIYSLHLPGGAGSRYTIDNGRGGRLTLEVVGLLKNSILQGSLLIAERDFLRYFPDVGGYRFFLIDTPPQSASTVETALEGTLGDYGFAAEPAGERLAGFLAVQNTYLATFQSLGGLGLLLGTLGLAVVQLRNVLERRSELALLRAIGFRRSTLAWTVALENAALLLMGLAVGVVAALVAVAPQLLSHEASIPWLSLVATLGLALVTGMTAGLLAVRAVLRAPLLAALREE